MPHLHVQISEELHDDLNRLIPVGSKTKVVEIVMRQVVKALSGPNREFALGAILTEYLNVVESYLPQKEEEDG